MLWTKIYLWTRKSPLNMVSHLDPDSPWRGLCFPSAKTWFSHTTKWQFFRSWPVQRQVFEIYLQVAAVELGRWRLTSFNKAMHCQNLTSETKVLVRGPSAWNRLPEVLRAVVDPVEFQKQLKTHFFTAAHNVYWYFCHRGIYVSMTVVMHPCACL